MSESTVSLVSLATTLHKMEVRLKEMHEAGQDTSNVTVCLTTDQKKAIDSYFRLVNQTRWSEELGEPGVLQTTKQMETRYGTVTFAVLDDDGFVVVPA